MTLCHISDLIPRVTDVRENFVTCSYVLVQLAEFPVGQRARVVYDGAINGDFPYVVEVSGHAYVFQLLARQPHLAGDCLGVPGYAVRMTARVSVLQINRRPESA